MLINIFFSLYIFIEIKLMLCSYYVDIRRSSLNVTDIHEKLAWYFYIFYCDSLNLIFTYIINLRLQGDLFFMIMIHIALRTCTCLAILSTKTFITILKPRFLRIMFDSEFLV